ncbi:MAG: cation:proton antiporter [Flavobacteriaceae bacterium]|jgi:Kef-type K+ transport system membrane component KefB|tara:strand:- start:1223 stop:2494 length:1272 start_codon:yes stop_codon:yes gene_type:complete
MDVSSILIVLPLLIIFSYLFDIFARRTKFPSVILLVLTGIIARFISSYYGYDNFQFLDSLVPVLGTIGLILIVLEAALELEIKKEKTEIIVKGFLAAFVILVINIILVSLFFENVIGLSYPNSVIYAIPLSIISSAVAIPSATGLITKNKEFVVYESTFSDILGIMIFYYCIRQAEKAEPLIGVEPIVTLLGQIILIIIISIAITYLLFLLIQRIEHHVKFFLILALLILAYEIGKDFLKLPSLVLIFIFGIFLSNFTNLIPKSLKKYIKTDDVKKSDLHEFHLLTAESTFLVRTFFFLFFGFSIPLDSFVEFEPYIIGATVLLIMYGVRYFYLALVLNDEESKPLLYFSPRGLITILLFLSISDYDIQKSNIVDEKVLLVIIIASMLIMIQGSIKRTKKEDEESNEPQQSLSEIVDSQIDKK